MLEGRQGLIDFGGRYAMVRNRPNLIGARGQHLYAVLGQPVDDFRG